MSGQTELIKKKGTILIGRLVWCLLRRNLSSKEENIRYLSCKVEE